MFSLLFRHVRAISDVDMNVMLNRSSGPGDKLPGWLMVNWGGPFGKWVFLLGFGIFHF